MSTIAELFSRDPNNCSKQDIRTLVEYYRTKWTQFNLGDLKAGSSKPRSAKDEEAVQAAKKLNLDDLL